AFVVMSVVVFGLSIAPWFLFGVDAVLLPGRFESVPIYTAYAVLAGVAGAIVGGWVCATIGRARVAIVVLAGLCIAGGVMNATMQQRKPDPGPRVAGASVMDAVTARKEPAWFTWLMPFVGASTVLLVGRRASAR